MSDGPDPLAATPGQPARPPLSAFRAALVEAGFRPSKSRGQNLLFDRTMLRAIARDARVEPGDFVLEVGPGCGWLTRELAELGAQVLAVEIDGRLAQVAGRHLARFAGVRLWVGDVLASKHSLAPEVRGMLPRAGPWHLVANLPYGLAGPLLGLLARLELPPASMTALVQLEVAERLAAAPGSRVWGALTARLAPLYRVDLIRRVGRELFWPRPRVEGAVVRLELQPAVPAPAELAEYDALVELLFQGRRKTLRRVLAGTLGREEAARLLAGAGIEASLRPEGLSVAQLLTLASRPEWRHRTGLS